MTETATLAASCYVCAAAPRLPYAHACRKCLGLAEPTTRCVAPLRCYCPAHLGRPLAVAIQAVRDELAEARARRAAAAQKGDNR